GLGGFVFMMLKGQIEKAPQLRLGLLIEAVRQRTIGDMARHLIGGKSKGAVAVEIAGKLVGDQDQGQGARRILFPGGKMPRGGFTMQRREPLVDDSIEGGVRVEPSPRPRFLP